MFRETIAPRPKIAGSQESNSLTGERLAKMHPDTRDIGDITTPRREIGLIAIKRPAHCDGLTVITVPISANAGNNTGAVLGLPEIEGLSLPSASSKSSAFPIAFVQLPPLPSATRRTQVPAVWLRRYPRPTRGPIFANTGFWPPLVSAGPPVFLVSLLLHFAP